LHAKGNPIKIALIAILVVVITVLHYGIIHANPELHILHRELYFIPILLASFWFGLRFGLTTSVVVSLIYAPHVLLYNDPHSTGLTVSSHILVFNLVAIVLGWLVDREKGQRQEILAKQAAEAYSKALEHELEKAREIQRDFLPDQIPQPRNWEIAAFFHPAIQVSGDFYDVLSLPGGNVGLVIADVCDKGVGSALFMALFRSLIRVFSGQTDLCELISSAVNEKVSTTIESQAATHDQISALKAVALTNDYIAEEHCEMCMFATIFFGVLNPATGLLAYINGGHEPVFIVGPAGVKESLRPTGPAVGMLFDSEFEIQQVQLEPGDILIGYTDGVTEARSQSDELFTRKRLQSLLEQPAATASDLLENIKIGLFTYTDKAPNSDDITMLAVRRASMEADILP
jgi:sigma-B regulation protein RsbU (phosphoserine phosphatase)